MKTMAIKCGVAILLSSALLGRTGEATIQSSPPDRPDLCKRGHPQNDHNIKDRQTAPRTDHRPNIVIILADDLGFSDLGCYGGEIHTPHLDKLAEQGLRFTQFYNCARCNPTRASLLTGLYPHEAGVGGPVNFFPPAYTGVLNKRCVTIAEVLRSVGYQTMMSGKWHLGTARPHWPIDRGFDRYFGPLVGGGSYWELLPGQHFVLDDTLWQPDPNDWTYYLTDEITNRAITFVDDAEKSRKPYFLYVAYTAPHWPLHAWPADIARYRGKYRVGWDEIRRRRHTRQLAMGLLPAQWPLSKRDRAVPAWDSLSDEDKDSHDLSMSVYAAMVDRMDQGIGRLMDRIRKTSTADNTLVMFLSDNGGCHVMVNRGKPGIPPGPRGGFWGYDIHWANASNTPFRKFKQYTHEGGISTPFICHWPDGIKQTGRITRQPGHIIDLMATCLNLAETKYPLAHDGQAILPQRGSSLVPIFQDRQRPEPPLLYWEHTGHQAVRMGPWKLVANRNRDWELYNLETDRTELKNLSMAMPEKASQLRSLYQTWSDQMHVVSWDVISRERQRRRNQPKQREQMEFKSVATRTDNAAGKNRDTCSLYGIFEHSIQAARQFDNPYTQVEATVTLEAPDNRIWKIPIFWDGGRRWTFRVSPDQVGTWKWKTRSEDPGLNQSGILTVAVSKDPGGVMPMSGHPRHFQRQNGKPFWFMGDTAWALFTDDIDERHDRSAVKKYIDARSAQGFSVIHAMLISEAGWGNSGGDAFADLSKERINPAYWQEVDRRLADLNRQGITAGLTLAWGDKRHNLNDWREFPSQTARLRYARYIAARYSAYNVYFIVAGEWSSDLRTHPSLTERQVRDEYGAIGATLKRNDPHDRMISIHPGTRPGSVIGFASQPWMSFGDYQQRYVNLHQSILDSRSAGKPVVNSEYAYYLRDQKGDDGKTDKNNSADLAMIRHATWDIVMAGGYFIIGFGSTYFGGHRHPGPFRVDDPRNDDWEAQVQHVRACFADLAWWRLEPNDGLITASVPRGRDEMRLDVVAPPAIAYWALAEPGRQYVFYMRGYSGPYHLSLGEPDNETYRIQLYNPRTGELSGLGLSPGKKLKLYSPPDLADWVLIVQTQDK